MKIGSKCIKLHANISHVQESNTLYNGLLEHGRCSEAFVCVNGVAAKRVIVAEKHLKSQDLDNLRIPP
jgi:hypothetical protein